MREKNNNNINLFVWCRSRQYVAHLGWHLVEYNFVLIKCTIYTFSTGIITRSKLSRHLNSMIFHFRYTTKSSSDNGKGILSSWFSEFIDPGKTFGRNYLDNSLNEGRQVLNIMSTYLQVNICSSNKKYSSSLILHDLHRRKNIHGSCIIMMLFQISLLVYTIVV